MRIWGAQVMVDHFSDFTYVRLMISTSQEEILAVKKPLVNGLTHLELKYTYIMQTIEGFF